MTRPTSIKEYEELDLKLGIKSSLPKLRSTLALAILFAEAAGLKSEIHYSLSQGNGIVISEEMKTKLVGLLSQVLMDASLSENDLIDEVNDNLLFKAQLEPLIVAFELIWKYAEIDFVADMAASAERTGGNRYEKVLRLTTNADLLHNVMKANLNGYYHILVKWLGLPVPIDEELELTLISTLSIFSEGAVFKLVDRGNDLIFNQEGIYEALVESSEQVNLRSDAEPKGPLRILNSFLGEALNPKLNYNNWVASPKENTEELQEYKQRVENYLKLNTKKIDIRYEVVDSTAENEVREENEGLVFNTNLESEFSRNRIVFGAPGTGKSFKINDEKDKLLVNGGEYERVTFHEDYSYAHFVGTYKPTMIDNDEDEGDPVISYEFVPGPFIRVYVKALKNARTDTPKPYLLIIEEINRATVARVFGDVFQLLDRDADEVSDYPIEASEDIKKYLSRELGGSPDDYNKIKIPNNMFLWATMNSADQGVKPMDTAFKRRWDFEYLGIDDGEDKIARKSVKLGKRSYEREIEWNALRKAINNELVSYKLNEDKLLGPFFLSLKVLGDAEEIVPEKFIKAFKSKILMYLFEDAARTKRQSLFEGAGKDFNRYSSVLKTFDKKGIFLFSKNIIEKLEPTTDVQIEEE